MWRWVVRCAVIAIVFGVVPPVRADNAPPFGVITVDQNGLAAPGACYALVTTDGAELDACDTDDGAADGTTGFAGVPAGAEFALSATVVPVGCAAPDPVERSLDSGPVLTVVVLCNPNAMLAGPEVDPAAIALRPSDLGQPGWLHTGAFIESIDGESRIQASYLGRGTDPGTVLAQLASFGWRRSYVSALALPSDLDSALILQRVRSYVTEYADAAGAAAGFGYLEDEQWIATAEDVPGSRTFGEQSELTADSGTSAIDGRPYRSLDLTFQTGNLVIGVTAIVYPSSTATEPDQAFVESLGSLLESRAAGLTAVGPTIGSRVVRLGGFGRELVTYDDAYYRFAGADVPLSDEGPSAASLRIKTYVSATDVYQLWQGVEAGTDAGFLYGDTLLEFATDEAAADWVGHLQAILAANPFYGDLHAVGIADAIGDQVTALRYVAGGGDASAPHAMLVAVQVGNRVARVLVVPQGIPGDVPLEPVIALARAQAACLANVTCSGIAVIPSALTFAPAATPVA